MPEKHRPLAGSYTGDAGAADPWLANCYAMPVYGEQRGLPHVELEVRQDLIADEAGQREWGVCIAAWLLQAASHAGVLAAPPVGAR